MDNLFNINKRSVKRNFNEIFLGVAYNDDYYAVEDDWVITPEEIYLRSDRAIQTVDLKVDSDALPLSANIFLARDDNLIKFDEFKFAKHITNNDPEDEKIIFTQRHANKVFAMGWEAFESLTP